MIEVYGVTPTQFIDVKGLMGDASDNIPGVPGIGEKTAYKLIQEYGSIENLLDNVESISRKKLQETLIENRESAIFSKKLATIITDVPIEINLEDIKSNKSFDLEGIRRFFFRMQFKSLLDKFPAENAEFEEAEDNLECSYEVINQVDGLKKLTDKLDGYKGITYITPYIENETVYGKLQMNYFILTTYEKENYVVEVKKLVDTSKDETVTLLGKIFHSFTEKVGYDMKNSYTALKS